MITCMEQVSATKLFNQLYSRHERRPFLSDEEWLWPSLPSADLEIMDDRTQDLKEGQMLKNTRVNAVLANIPQVLPFKQRVAILEALLAYDSSLYRGHVMGPGGAVQVNVRRDHLIEDAFKFLSDKPQDKLKGRIQIHFISENGTEEAGIDGGGLFKAFIDEFIKACFDPAYAIFVPTTAQLLVPNPSSEVVDPHRHLELFYFFGTMLGKAMYEGILVEPQFSGVFLNVLLGRPSSIDDLTLLDAQLHKSLVNLQDYVKEGGEVADLQLFFEVSREEFGAVVSHELIPGGSSIPVTNNNLADYILGYAHFKLNVEIKEQCRYFLKGFRNLIPVNWIRMFSSLEMQKLISGDRQPIDIADMRRHVAMSGYTESDPYIQSFWEIINSFSIEEQGYFLKFVTSCSRQPLLGFGQLNPKFGIQRIPKYEVSDHSSSNSAPRLPTAATCFNLLKLPKYDSIEMLREKLLYAITSNSGFELT